MVEIITRGQWGARSEGGTNGARLRSHVILHTWAGPLASVRSPEAERRAMRDIDNFHIGRFGKHGFAYSWHIERSGRIYEGRGVGKNGSHTQQGRNNDGYAISYPGHGDHQANTEIQHVRTAELIRWMLDNGLLVPDYRLSGHFEWANRSCPGILVRSRFTHIRNLVNNPGVSESMEEEEMKRGHKNQSETVYLQKYLNLYFHGLTGHPDGCTVDGVFGDETHAYVVEFQKREKFDRTGVVTPIMLIIMQSRLIHAGRITPSLEVRKRDHAPLHA